MKLIFCQQCQDVRKIMRCKTYCLCGKSWGEYWNDGINANIGGLSIVIGIRNDSFATGIRNITADLFVGNSLIEFTSFIMLESNSTIHKVEEDSKTFNKEDEKCLAR